MTPQEKVAQITKRLSPVFPNPVSELNYSTPFELLVAVMLSAQTTDKLVNTLTPALFAKYPTAKDYANAPIEEIQSYIRKVNFYLNKSKNIQASAKIIAEKYNGKVPDTMEELDALPGVARKTANVVLWNIFHKNEGICVDTHVIRLANKLGLTKQKDPIKIEQDLMKIVPKKDWGSFPNLLILFGRRFCPARPHICTDCPLGDLCPDLMMETR